MAFITPKEGFKGEFKPSNVDQFDFVPSLNGLFTSDMNLLKKNGSAKIDEIMENEVLERYPQLKGIKVIVRDKVTNQGEEVNGKFNFNTKIVELKRQNSVKMDKVLDHEIQHAIDKESGTFISSDGKVHSELKQEQQALTNELLREAERRFDSDSNEEDVIKWFDSRIEKTKGRALGTQAEMAKEMFLRFIRNKTVIV